jgi:hypothetical protein
MQFRCGGFDILRYSSIRMVQNKEQSVPDLHTLLGFFYLCLLSHSPRNLCGILKLVLGPRSQRDRIPSRQRKRRATNVQEENGSEPSVNGNSDVNKEPNVVGAPVEERRKIESEKISKIGTKAHT